MKQGQNLCLDLRRPGTARVRVAQIRKHDKCSGTARAKALVLQERQVFLVELGIHPTPKSATQTATELSRSEQFP